MRSEILDLMPEEELVQLLPGDLKRIAEIAGVRAALEISREFRGSYVYIGGLDGFSRELRDLGIRRDYDQGIRVRMLSTKYSLSPRQIRNVLKGFGRD